MNLYDTSEVALSRAVEDIRFWLDSLARSGMVEEAPEEVLRRIRPLGELAEALKGVDYVQESVPEDLGVKRRVFREVSRLVKPSTILASSTSGLPISEVQRAALNPERCLTVHPVNPPHLIPLVEIVPGRETAEEVVEETYSFMQRVGKVPVVVRKEVPGFVFNRLAAALWREALDLVDKEVVSVEDLDRVVSAGLGLRLAVMGPFLTYQLGGGEGGLRHFIEHLKPAFTSWWRSLADWSAIPPSAVERAVKGAERMRIVQEKTYKELAAWRDERLTRIIRELYREPA